MERSSAACVMRPRSATWTKHFRLQISTGDGLRIAACRSAGTMQIQHGDDNPRAFAPRVRVCSHPKVAALGCRPRESGGGHNPQFRLGRLGGGRAMNEIGVGIIGAGWCGGIRAETCASHPLVKSLHIAEIRAERLREIGAKTRANTTTA